MTDNNRDDATIKALIHEAIQEGQVARELTADEADVMKCLVALGHFSAFDGPWTTGVSQPTEYTLTTSALVLLETFYPEGFGGSWAGASTPARADVVRSGAAPGWEKGQECYFRLDEGGQEFNEMWDLAEKEAEIFVAPLREQVANLQRDLKREKALYQMQRDVTAKREDERNDALAALNGARYARDTMKEALERVNEALRGVVATEAGGLTGDPRVDAIAALRVETSLICDHLDARGSHFLKMAETFSGLNGEAQKEAHDRLTAIGSALREESRRIRGGNYDR